MADPTAFYDDLADDYHLNYFDWEASVRRQGKSLARLVRERLGDDGAHTVLDCSCGIGTQAIGLALQGFDVTATDLSPNAVARARREAARAGVVIDFSVADMRNVAAVVPGTFDIVISCDNSVPHLLTDDDLRLALRNMHEKLKPGGLLIIGIRDYDALVEDRPRFTPPQVVDRADQRSVLFQLWDWAEDGGSYELTMFVHKQVAGAWDSAIHVARYRALWRAELEQMAGEVRFSGIQWHAESLTGHHQPLLTAIRPKTEGRT